MNIKNILAVAGLFLLLRSAAGTAANAVINKIGVLSVKFRSINLQGLNLTINLSIEVRNDTPVDGNITAIRGNVFYNAIAIIPVVLSTPVFLAANSTKVLEVALTGSIASLGSNILTIFQTGGFSPNNMKIEGYITASGIDVPFSKNIINIG